MRTVTSLALVACVLLGCCSAAVPTPAHRITADYSFEQYVSEYGKTYRKGSSEYAMRHFNFKLSLSKVVEHNVNPAKTYWKGINKFSDWTEEEFKAIRGARLPHPSYKSKYEVPFVRDPNLTLATTLDYRKAFPTVLTAVKDQGMCGDCWAHAVTEAIESAYAIKTGELYVLSQQQVTSCTPAHFTCYSCNGSYPRLAYDFVAEAGPAASSGLVQEWQYSFESYTGTFPVCMPNMTVPSESLNSTVGLLGYTQIAFNEEQDILAALNSLGPLSILVDASSWGDYAGGVFTGCKFGPNFGLDHAVLLVGYGYDAASDLAYWIVRNSWSAAWGEDGYIRIARTATTQCGVTGGLSCQSNYTANISACGPCGMFTDAQFPLVNLSASAPPFLRTRSEIVRPGASDIQTSTVKPPLTRKAPRAHELTSDYSFAQYCHDFGKKYQRGTAEYATREKTFEANLRRILQHNSNPHASWRAGVNRFTDRTRDEMKRMRGSRHEPNFKPRDTEVSNSRMYEFKGVPIASELDYRKAWPPVLTAVKDQNECGDCWAHAVTESIESSYARSTGQLLVLSQQQITSCTPAENDCFGCNGMYPRYAFEYASTAQYIMEEWVYPFTSFNGNTPVCTNQTNPPYPLQTTVQVLGYTQVAPNRQEHVLEALNTLGPLAVLVDASDWSFYESGVFNSCNASFGIGLDHAVLLVGYGYDATFDTDYWIIRNSWNPSFGEHGYIRLQKTAASECGYNRNGLSCFASTPQPTPACGMCGVLSDAQFPLTSLQP